MTGKLLQERYQVVQVLRTAEFSHTYLAQDTRQSDRPICIVKHLQPVSNQPNSLPTLRRLFNREVEALEKLGNYDRVPRLIAHFEEDQEFYLVQEFIEGHSLSVELQSGQRWSEQQVVQLLQEVLGILEVIHSHGLIHRELRPSNLIRRQHDGQLVLIGFGSVKQAWTQVVTTQGQTHTNFAVGIPTTIAIGSPGYMPMEQERGRPRPNSDIYALGMIGIQALTGLHPSQLLEDVNSGEMLWQQQALVSPQLADVLNKMAHHHFQDRYQTATDVLQALEPIASVYLRQEHSEFSQQPSIQKAPSSVTPTPMTQAPTRGQENKLVRLFQPLASSIGSHPSDASVAGVNGKIALLFGIAIGFVSAVAFVLGFYYFLQPPTVAPQFPEKPIPTPSQNTTNDNN